MKKLLASPRSRFLFVLGILAIGIGVLSRKINSYPSQCSPVNNQKITHSFEI